VTKIAEFAPDGKRCKARSRSFPFSDQEKRRNSVKIQKQTNLLTQRALTVGEALDESAETSAAGNADLHFTDRAQTLASLLRILHGPVEIESLRLGERLKVEQTLDPDALRVLMPPFSLQPLVEDAVQPGSIPRHSLGGSSSRSV